MRGRHAGDANPKFPADLHKNRGYALCSTISGEVELWALGASSSFAVEAAQMYSFRSILN